MARPRLDTSGFRFKVFLALAAAILALGGIALTAVRATRIATEGADRVEDEFSEYVSTETALASASANFELSLEVIEGGRLGAVTLRPQMDKSDRQLGAAIGRVLAPSRIREPERDATRQIRAAYDRYEETRGDVRTAAAKGSSTPAGDERLRATVRPLRTALMTLAGIHFDEAEAALEEIKQGGFVRNVALFLTVALGVLSLVGVALLVRGIVKRVRAYGRFAHGVAGGDLTTRLDPRGRDELDALGRSLNEMVEQLAAAAGERDELDAAERRYRETQDGFGEILRVAESEREALAVLRRHIERVIPGSAVSVLDRTGRDTADRSAPAAGDAGQGEERERANGRTCVGMRLARTLASDADEQAMLSCDICGQCSRACCVPLLISGGVLGSVLVVHPEPLDRVQSRHLHDSVAQAAPILANLRNLAAAQHRAATDPLTGLPNRRSVDAALRRMTAASRRRGTPLAAIMIDLDHFKQINDTYGHDLGDRVLADVASTLASAIRVSDFVGRAGGEEFVVLLPDSDADAALGVAEKLRTAVAALTFSGIDRPVTASFGVSVHPDTAEDGEALLRVADSALYAAKAAGRDRVKLGVPGQPGRAQPTVVEVSHPAAPAATERPSAPQRERHPLTEVGDAASSESFGAGRRRFRPRS